MKKLFLGMFAAAGMLLAASCSNEDLETAGLSGNECVVTFNLQQPGISTRVYSDGLTATTLTYAVYEKDSKVAQIVSKDAVTFSSLTATVNLRLIKGKSYDIIFWADAPESPYTFDEAAQTITVSYDGVTSQDETRDAFYAVVKDLKVEGTVSQDVTLTRPFAQLNIGTIDLEEAHYAGYTPKQSKVTVSNVYNTLNLYDGSVSNVVDNQTSTDKLSVTYALADIPELANEEFPVPGVIYDNKYYDITYLSMDYLLVPDERDITDVEITVTMEPYSEGSGESTTNDSSTPYEITNSYPNVPVQRNYRTNIYGYLLTDDAEFTISIDPEYESNHITRKIESEMAVEDYKHASSVSTLATAISEAGAANSGNSVIVIDADITFANTDSWTSVKVDGYNGADVITIYGNGHTITGIPAPLFSSGFAGGCGLVIYDLTIADSKIVSTNNLGSGAFIEVDDAMDEVTLDNCHVKNCTITGSRTGGLIGWTAGYDKINDGPVRSYINVINSSVEGCTITGAGTVGGIIGQAGTNSWTWNTIKNCKVVDCTLTTIKNDATWQVGGIVGTANVGTVVIDDCTIKNTTMAQYTAVSGGTEVTYPEDRGVYGTYYGRLAFSSTGSLTIDGTSITQ